MIAGDTITAISSATGASARMILRLSGPAAQSLAERCWTSADATRASQGTVAIGQIKVPGWLYRFPAPASYTGEDLVEFHIPGNPLLAKLLLEQFLRMGARLADPGEFTARAYFNGRIDLTEAEGVAATIAAGNEQELSAARRLLSGELARRLAPITEQIAHTLALLEVGIDFVDEEVTFLSESEIVARLAAADALLGGLLRDSVRFERLVHEPSVVLVGRPNAGKSTLLNSLAGHDRALVSPVAGTTRDVLSVQVALPRGMIRLADVAGLEQTSNDSTPESTSEQSHIDAKMREHALRALREADCVVMVQDAVDLRPPLELPRAVDMVVMSKIDLLPAPPVSLNAIPLSAKTATGLESFRAALDRFCFGETSATAALALNARHVQAIEETRAALAHAITHADAGLELLALDLREALDALGRVAGRMTADDLLGRIFSAFCIGK